jgi:hypothetical protein
MTGLKSRFDVVQIWLAGLVALTTIALLQLHLWPKRLTPLPPALGPLPGFPLKPFPGRSDARFAISSTLRRQLPSGLELRLTTITSLHAADFQVAALTQAMPSLQLRQRRLADQDIAIGTIDNQLALQTCLIGGRYGFTGKSLLGLVPPKPIGDKSLPYHILFGQPQPRTSCLLVTLVQDRRVSPDPGFDSESMLKFFKTFLAKH